MANHRVASSGFITPRRRRRVIDRENGGDDRRTPSPSSPSRTSPRPAARAGPGPASSAIRSSRTWLLPADFTLCKIRNPRFPSRAERIRRGAAPCANPGYRAPCPFSTSNDVIAAAAKLGRQHLAGDTLQDLLRPGRRRRPLESAADSRMMHLDDLISRIRTHRIDPGGTPGVPPMNSADRRRLANGRTPYRGLLPPDRPGDGVLVLDRNPRAGFAAGTAWLLGLLCVPLSATALLCRLVRPTARAAKASAPGLSWPVSSGTGIRGAAASVRSLERIRIDASGLEYLRIDGLLRRRRVIPLPEIRRLTPYSVMVRRGRESTIASRVRPGHRDDRPAPLRGTVPRSRGGRTAPGGPGMRISRIVMRPGSTGRVRRLRGPGCSRAPGPILPPTARSPAAASGTAPSSSGPSGWSGFPRMPGSTSWSSSARPSSSCSWRRSRRSPLSSPVRRSPG